MSDSQQSPRAPSPAAQSPAAALLERAFGTAAHAAAAITSRRGMTSVVVGVAIVLLAWVGERDSAWAAPMLAAGLALIALGLIGPRLSGSLSLRWGEDGAFFQLTSTVAPPGQRKGAPALAAGADEEAGEEGEEAPPLLPPTEIDGQAETIEISVAALKDAAAEVAGTAGDEASAESAAAARDQASAEGAAEVDAADA